MFGSAVVYSGLIVAAAGLALVAIQARWRPTTRVRSSIVAGAGALLLATGVLLPARESRVAGAQTRLDEFAPAWQFREVHTIHVAASPARAFDAVKRVRADEILLFRTLTWIRRRGQATPESILNPGTRESLLDVATHTTFVGLADDPPRELVLGTVILAPPSARGGTLTPQLFQRDLPPGFILATMNFLITPDGQNGSVVSSETRVYANSPDARRRFAVYWRLIYPGSAIIRRMWLRAIERRAITESTNDQRLTTND